MGEIGKYGTDSEVENYVLNNDQTYGELEDAMGVEAYKAFGKEQVARKFQGKSERPFFFEFPDKLKIPLGRDRFKKMTAKYNGSNDRIKKSEERQAKMAEAAVMTLKGNFEQRRSGWSNGEKQRILFRMWGY